MVHAFRNESGGWGLSLYLHSRADDRRESAWDHPGGRPHGPGHDLLDRSRRDVRCSTRLQRRPTDGNRPSSGLLRASDGVLYGTTQFGGTFGQGTVFAITPEGTVTIPFSFNGGGADGTHSDAALILAADGNFYGTTGRGGLYGFGTIFTMTPGGIVTVLHSFDSGSSEASTNAALLQATDGNFYGTSAYGGPSGLGRVYRITAAGTFTVLHSFTGDSTDGAYPVPALIQAIDGKLYGTTASGGGSDQGTVFTITPDTGTFTILHSFNAETTGANPAAALVQATDGNFYGSTQAGGTFDMGTLFAITPGGTVTLLHTFAGGPADGAYPRVSVIQAVDGNFYGSTPSGGAGSQGIVFTITPAGSYNVLHHFLGSAYDGAIREPPSFRPPTGISTAPLRPAARWKTAPCSR